MPESVLTDSRKTRYEYVDIAKGIAIVLCVIGHAVAFGSMAFRYIFSFHMPFFFFISGWCKATSKNPKPLWIQIKRDAVKLLLPSFIYRIIWSIGIGDLRTALIRIFADPETEWFLPTMFCVNILFYFFQRYDNKVRGIPVLLRLMPVAATCFGFMYAAVLYNQTGHWMEKGFPFPVECILFAFPFSVAGCYARLIWEKHPFELRVKSKDFLLFWMLAMINLVVIPLNGYVNICQIELGDIKVLGFCSAVFGSLATIWIASIIHKYEHKALILPLSRSMQFWGKNSLWMYLGHTLLFKIMRESIAKYNIHMSNFVTACVLTSVAIITISAVLLLMERCKKSRKQHKSTNNAGN